MELGFGTKISDYTQCHFQCLCDLPPGCSVSEREEHRAHAPCCGLCKKQRSTVQLEPQLVQTDHRGCFPQKRGDFWSITSRKGFPLNSHTKRLHAPFLWALGTVKGKLKGHQSSLNGALHSGTLFAFSQCNGSWNYQDLDHLPPKPEPCLAWSLFGIPRSLMP